MRRAVWWLVAVGFLGVSCSASTGDQSAESTAPAADWTTVAVEDDGPLAGRLVVVDGIGNVVVMDPDGSNPVHLTDDAGSEAFYAQPIWSPTTDTIAWGQISAGGFGVVLADTNGSPHSVVDSTGLPFFLHFSPDGEHLAVLNNGSDGIEFSVIDVDVESLTRFDQESPYYLSWSPDDDLLAAHAGGSRFETLDPTTGARETVGATDAGYLSPQWITDGIIHIVDGELVIQDERGVTTPLAAVGAFTTFVANPQGSHIALQTSGSPAAITVALTDTEVMPNEMLVVLDIETETFEVVSDELTLGYFWSPGGESLLALVPDETQIRPIVWNLDGSTAEYGVFRPSPVLARDVLPFFPQYAQSLRLWSPDSKAFAIPSSAGVLIQRLDAAEPVPVSAGFWVAWSHR